MMTFDQELDELAARIFVALQTVKPWSHEDAEGFSLRTATEAFERAETFMGMRALRHSEEAKKKRSAG